MGKTFGTQDDQGSVLEKFVKRTKLTGATLLLVSLLYNAYEFVEGEQ